MPQARRDFLLTIAIVSAAYEVGRLDIPDDVGTRMMGVGMPSHVVDAMAPDAKPAAIAQEMRACAPVLQPVLADLAAFEEQLRVVFEQQQAALQGLQQEIKKQTEWFGKRLQARGAFAGNGRSKAHSTTTNLKVSRDGATSELVIGIQSLADPLSDDEIVAGYCPTAKEAAEYCRLTRPITPIKVKIVQDAAEREIDGRVLHCLVAAP